MKITPFGKLKGQDSGMSAYANLFGDQSDDSGEDMNSDDGMQNHTKIDELQDAIEQVVGEPSLDNLMIILAAIGMSQLNIKVSQDNSSLSVSGIIDFSEPEEEKIGRKE